MVAMTNIYKNAEKTKFAFFPAPYEVEDPYPSLSDYHDYEPQLEFDDAELLERKPEEEFVGEG